MHRFLLTLAFVRENRNLIISLAALALFVVFGVMAFFRIGELSVDIEAHKAQVIALNEKVANYEAEIEQSQILGADIIELIEENDVLSDKVAKLTEANDELVDANNELTDANSELVAENDGLTTKNSELATVNGELERQNGELTKKLNGLKPN